MWLKIYGLLKLVGGRKLKGPARLSWLKEVSSGLRNEKNLWWKILLAFLNCKKILVFLKREKIILQVHFLCM